MEVNIQKRWQGGNFILEHIETPLLNHRKITKVYKGSKKANCCIKKCSYILTYASSNKHTYTQKAQGEIRRSTSKNLKREHDESPKQPHHKKRSNGIKQNPTSLGTVNLTKNLHMLNLTEDFCLKKDFQLPFAKPTYKKHRNTSTIIWFSLKIKLYIIPPNIFNQPPSFHVHPNAGPCAFSHPFSSLVPSPASTVAFMATALRSLRKERRPAAKETASVSKKRSAGNGKFPTKWAPKLYMEL